jgi:hypothetical protein
MVLSEKQKWKEWGEAVSASCIADVSEVVSSSRACWYAIYAVLTRLLSPAWGAMGVAIAFSATEISFHPLLFWMYGIDRVDYRKIFPGIIIGSAFMALLWYCARHSLWAAAVSAAAYLIFWYARNRKTLISARKAFVLPAWR